MSFADGDKLSTFVSSPNGAFARAVGPWDQFDMSQYRTLYGNDATMHATRCRDAARGGPSAQDSFLSAMKALSRSLPQNVWGSAHGTQYNGGARGQEARKGTANGR